MNMHADIASRPVSYQDVLDAPPHRVAEIVNGVFYLQAKPAPPHGEVAGGLMSFLRDPFQMGRGGPGGWWIQAEPELYFGSRDYRTLVPDLAGWRRERLPVLPRRWADLKVAPDWVCEILSPSTMRLDRTQKMAIYAEAGIAHLWMADPLACTLEIFELIDGRWTLTAAHGGKPEISAAPFDTVPLTLGDLWLPEEETDDDPQQDA